MAKFFLFKLVYNSTGSNGLQLFSIIHVLQVNKPYNLLLNYLINSYELLFLYNDINNNYLFQLILLKIINISINNNRKWLAQFNKICHLKLLVIFSTGLSVLNDPEHSGIFHAFTCYDSCTVPSYLPLTNYYRVTINSFSILCLIA